MWVEQFTTTATTKATATAIEAGTTAAHQATTVGDATTKATTTAIEAGTTAAHQATSVEAAAIYSTIFQRIRISTY